MTPFAVTPIVLSGTASSRGATSRCCVAYLALARSRSAIRGTLKYASKGI